MSVLKFFKTWVVALAVFILSLIILETLVIFNVVSLENMSARLNDALLPIFIFSLSIIFFSFISVQYVSSTASRLKKLGVKINKNLLDDYIVGCFTILILSIIKLLLLLLNALVSLPIVVLTIISTCISLTFTTMIILLGLFQITELTVKTIFEIEEV